QALLVGELGLLLGDRLGKLGRLLALRRQQQLVVAAGEQGARHDGDHDGSAAHLDCPWDAVVEVEVPAGGVEEADAAPAAAPAFALAPAPEPPAGCSATIAGPEAAAASCSKKATTSNVAREPTPQAVTPGPVGVLLGV